MGLQALAEGIILQSIDDLWDENLRDESISFFKGKDFCVCAEIACMPLADQVRLLTVVKAAINEASKKVTPHKIVSGQGEKRRRRPQRESAHSFA